MLGADYLELLGVLQDTPLNRPMRDCLQRRGDCLERMALLSHDAAATAQALRDRGIDAHGPLALSRPVDLPDGQQVQAAFSLVNWPAEHRPSDIALFACQQHTRDAVWLPGLQNHANTATAIKRIEIIGADPPAAAARLAHLIDAQTQRMDDGVLIATAPGRADLVFLTRDAFIARHPSAPPNALPTEGAAALVLAVRDIKAAAAAAGALAVTEGGGRVVASANTSGVMLVFEPA